MIGKWAAFGALGLIGWTVQSAAMAQAVDSLRAGFQNVPESARMRMFWRVFGPAWTREEIDYQFGVLKAAHVGGVTTFFFYPVALDDSAKGVHNQRFLSPEFLETLAYTADKAKEMGLRFTVAGGTGWPYGGPMVSAQDAAQRVRREMISPAKDGGYRLPTLRAGERCLAAFLDGKDVTDRIQGNRLEAPIGANGMLQLFIVGPTGMQVKRPALGGEGPVLDHYSRAAAERYLESAVRPILNAAPGAIHSLFCDSLEVYNANWTHDLPAEFRKRRGYDLIPNLPELFDEKAARAPDLRFDFWRTLAELTEERFTKVVSEWCHKNGVPFEMEAYGSPPNPLTAARYIDVPTGEQYEWKGFSFSRFAASGAHLAGKRVIGAEAWTWLGIPNRLADSLSDLKLASDLHFLAGENDLTGVEYPYSPRWAGAPGWLPYFGPVMNQNNPQWPYFHCLADYVNRCQWLLRQGAPVADVAIYLPVEDSFAAGPVEQMLLDFHIRDLLVSGEKTSEFGLQKALQHHSDLLHTLLTHGFNYDGIDVFAMNRLASVKDGRLIAGDVRCSILILPNLEGMEVAALERAARFCREGGTVIATHRLPDRSYGLRSSRDDSARVKALIVAMFGAAPGAQPHSYGKGRAIFVSDDRDSLESVLAGLNPDVRIEPYQPEVSFVHRRAGNRDLYFLANVGEKPAAFTADFRVRDKAASVWNPMDGSVRSLTAGPNGGYTRVRVALSPRGSTFVVFESAGKKLPSLPSDDGKIETLVLSSSSWRVTFEGPDAPAPREMADLASWTAWPDAKYFSGQATYTADLEWKGAPPKRCRIRFEQVREVAEVKVNGRSAGVAWTPPYEVDITPLLRSGTNTLGITVANLPVNRFLGLPDEDLGPLRAAYGNRFPAPQEKQIMRKPALSGLIGKVYLEVQR